MAATVSDPADVNDPLSYQWTVIFDENVVAAGAESDFSFTPWAGGTFNVSLTVYDDDGGMASDSAVINVAAVAPLDAVNDDQDTGEGVPVDIPAVDNDLPTGDVEILEFTQSDDGTVTDNGDGSLNFTPDSEFTSGSTTFDYTIGTILDELSASDGDLADWFGYSVAINYDLAVIGAKLDDDGATSAGAVYIFQRTGLETWTEITKLTADDPEAHAQFGQSVAVDGDTVVVGAWIDDANGINSGAAYVFQRDHGGADSWGQVAKLTGSGTTGSDKFGWSVGIDGDTVVVGAIGDDPLANASGAAYVFQRDQGGEDNWGEVAQLVAADGAAIDILGFSVGIDDDTIVVGAYLADAPAVNSGAAYVFQRDVGGADNWGQVKKLVADDGQAADQFGYSVAVDGDRIAVGSRLEDFDNVLFVSNAGSVYVFERDSGGADNWGQTAKIYSDDVDPGDRLGSSVALQDDIILSGAELDDETGTDAGAAYLFQLDDMDNWFQARKLVDPQGITNDKMGVSVALDGPHALVGSFVGDSATPNSGIALIQHIGTDTATVTVEITPSQMLLTASQPPQAAPLQSSSALGQLPGDVDLGTDLWTDVDSDIDALAADAIFEDETWRS
jgi:hypothetical protein